jgi:hypothetical protein
MGIEPTSEAWEARNKTLKAIDLAALSYTEKGFSWKRDGNSRSLQIAPLSLPILIVASGWMRILFAEFSKALEDRRAVWISLPFTGAIPAS